MVVAFTRSGELRSRRQGGGFVPTGMVDDTRLYGMLATAHVLVPDGGNHHAEQHQEGQALYPSALHPAMIADAQGSAREIRTGDLELTPWRQKDRAVVRRGPQSAILHRHTDMALLPNSHRSGSQPVG